MDRRGKRRKGRGILLTMLFLAVSGSAVWLLFYAPFFDVAEVYVVWAGRFDGEHVVEDPHRLSYEEIIGQSGAQVGENIFRMSISSIKQSVAELPYVKECDVRREFPNKIKIWVRESGPGAVVCYESPEGSPRRFAVLDFGGRVLEVGEVEINEYGAEPVEGPVDEATEGFQQMMSEYNVPVIAGLDIIGAVPGKAIQAGDRDRLDAALECMKEIVDNELLRDVRGVDVTNLGDIILDLRGRIEVHLGDRSQLNYKFLLLGSAWRPPYVSEYERGRLVYTVGGFNFIPRG